MYISSLIININMGNSFKYLFNAIENNSHKYQFVDELILNKSINSNLLFYIKCLSITSTFFNFMIN